MKTCLITGGCGFIGRHFTKKMCDLGYNVDIVDNMSSNSSLDPQDWMEKIKCNLTVFQFRIRMDQHLFGSSGSGSAWISIDIKGTQA